MSKRSDIRNYYRTLGTSSSATSEELKAAYRKLAKELHPDLHQNSSDATSRFQKLSEAYEILSDQNKRAAYDAECAAGSDSEREVQEVAPIKCAECGVTTAQPRYVIFPYVVSLILVTYRRYTQGIFCPKCAQKKAIQASATTWLLGWWGVPFGPIFTIGAIFRNLLNGEMPPDANFQILKHQGIYFGIHNKPELANAALDQAARFSITEIANVRLAEIRRLLPTVSVALVDRWALQRRWAFGVQLLPLILLPTAVAWASRIEILDGLALKAIAHVTQSKAAIYSNPSETSAVVEIIRPFTNFEVLSGRGESEFEKVVSSAGTTGYVAKSVLTYGDGTDALREKCLPLGSPTIPNGTVFLQKSNGPHTIKVQNGQSSDAVVKLRDTEGRTALSFYVSANSETEIPTVPEGTFTIEFATGNDFSPTCGYFLENMRTKRFTDADSFVERVEGNQIIDAVLTVTLNPVSGGNAHTSNVDSSNFESD
jgi:hypothetical protein